MKNKVKEFINCFLQIFVTALLITFGMALFIVPIIIIETPYFVIPWLIFLTSLYTAIIEVFFSSSRKR